MFGDANLVLVLVLLAWAFHMVKKFCRSNPEQAKGAASLMIKRFLNK